MKALAPVYFLNIEVYIWIYYAAFCISFSVFSAWLFRGVIIASANISISIISITLSIIAISGRSVSVKNLNWGTEGDFLSNMEAYIFALMLVVFCFSTYASVKQYFLRR